MRRPLFVSPARRPRCAEAAQKLPLFLPALLLGCGAVAEDASRLGVNDVSVGADAGVATPPENPAPGLTGPLGTGSPALPASGNGSPAPTTEMGPEAEEPPNSTPNDASGSPVTPNPTSPASEPLPLPTGSASQGAGGSMAQGGGAGTEPEDASSNGGSPGAPVMNGGAAGNSSGGRSPASGGAGGDSEIPTPSAFNIELVFDDVETIDASVLDAFRIAEQRWEAVIIGDLPDVAANVAGDCNGHTVPNGVDDVVIFVSVVSFDGPQGLLGAAGPCAIRSAGTRLPFAGAMEFDEDDLQSFAAMGRLDEIVLHEMGHVLGIGSMWEALALLDDPSDGSGMADTAFNGSQARAAFNSVGGDSYEGNKVPVENSGGEGEINGHWRESALGSELMTTKMGSSPAQLSVVTIASLQDLGYTVSFDMADDYRWPSVDEAFAFKSAGGPALPTVIDLSDDHLALPLYEVSQDGAVRWLTPNPR